MWNRKIHLAALLLLATATMALAQENAKEERFNPTNYGAVFLGIAPDARAGALGDLGGATEADANSQYWNPAKYPFNIARAGIAINYTPWLRQLVNDINLANVAGFYRLGDHNALSASLNFFSLGEVMFENDDAMTINPYEFSFDVAYSRMLSERFSMAVGLRFIYSDVTWDYTAESKAGTAFAADIAMYRKGYFKMGKRECSMAWGININNIGTKISQGTSSQSEFLPTNLRVGINWTIPFNQYNSLSLCADANKLLVPTYPRFTQKDFENGECQEHEIGSDIPVNHKLADERFYEMSPITGMFKSFYDAPGGFKEEMREIQLSAGMEYNYNDRFMIRLGYHHEHPTKGNRKYVTAGAGFHMSVFTVDAAYVFSTAQTCPLDQTMRFTLGFDLDGMKDLFGKNKKGKSKSRKR